MDQWTRIKWMLGLDIMSIIKNTHVLIIGVGGVGSYATESLIRSGIEHITMIDYDKIDITNLNRQLMTNINNLGKPKIDALEERIKQINPNCTIQKQNTNLSKNQIKSIINQINPDYIIDACDTIEVKKELIRVCINQKIPLISCMGTGNKLDPTKLQITDIRKTNYDPIAKIIRKMVKEENIKEKIPVVWSNEQPIKTPNHQIGSMIFVPSTAGILCASYIINQIIKNNKETIK